MYYVSWVGRPSVPWAVCQCLPDGEASPAVDYFRIQSSAEHAVSLLNRGRARIEPHRPLGCRVQPVPAPRAAA